MERTRGNGEPPPVATVARELPPFSLQQRDLSPAEAAYLCYYGIDFQAQFGDCEYSLGYLATAENRIAVQAWRRPGARRTLLIVHGYFDHVGLFGHLIRFGLARGSNVVAFDLPGHGLSSGEPAVIDDFDSYCEALDAVVARLGELGEPGHALDLVAQSTGGAVAMEYLYRAQPAPFSSVVLLAPLVRPQGWRWIRLLHLLLGRWVSQVSREFAANSGDPEFLRFLREDPLQSRVIPVRWIGALRRWMRVFLARDSNPCALLLLQGDRDGTVDWRFNIRQITRLFPAAQVAYLPGGRHHLANDSEEIRSKLMALMESYLERGHPPAQG